MKHACPAYACRIHVWGLCRTRSRVCSNGGTCARKEPTLPHVRNSNRHAISMYKVPTSLPARTSMHYRWWWNIVPDKSSTKTGIWIETRSINSRRSVDLDQRLVRVAGRALLWRNFSSKAYVMGCECGRDLFTAVIWWIKMHLPFRVIHSWWESVHRVLYTLFRCAGVSYDYSGCNWN